MVERVQRSFVHLSTEREAGNELSDADRPEIAKWWMGRGRSYHVPCCCMGRVACGFQRTGFASGPGVCIDEGGEGSMGLSVI